MTAGCWVWSDSALDLTTNNVPVAASSANEAPAEVISTNDVALSVTNTPIEIADIFPIEVDAYVAANPTSSELIRLFSSLGSDELDAVEVSREILVKSLAEGQGRAGVEALRKYLRVRAGSFAQDDSVALDEMSAVACCARSLEAFQDASDISPQVWSWLFTSNERIRLVAETLTDDDNTSEAALIIQKLYDHDPESRDQFLNLILAMAVVWDTPRREMHNQIGEGWLPPDEDVSLYYDYFKRLYSSAKTKVSYDELSVDSLVFVVDVPTPLGELEWALENVDGSRSLWGKHYDEITYDLTRLLRKIYIWPHHEYTLQEIQECFGICVDQAYYCVVSARAHGIPCLYFHGRGKYGGHAWFGFMKRKEEWEMDIGRYSKQGYATGFAIHPQTDREMTDHELEYFCSRALQPKKFRDASVLVHLAEILQDEDFFSGALAAARKAREVDSLCDAAWEMECEVLVNTDCIEDAIELLKEKAVCFKYFPDVAADALQQQAVLLKRSGDALAAEKLLRREVARVASRRDDLQQDLVLAQANQLLAQGNAREGMEAIERILRDQRKDGSGQKVYVLIVEYKKFAERAGLSSDADRFLASYYR
ncbi:hypothetical protein [Tichowtungia aerotolerans]|uniref:Uncharacterized protein n=1 Tax=Tichowtungia aerotolerans TaxID=2697043 RepID=A0A6P1M974_9BACT|nr:hypothetical protein [Tichowtungia aerotolerans]QHI70582.1 hypothetical protein GT409_14410 [Tichowtungia aerotolerans]